MEKTVVRAAQPRTMVQVRFADGRTYEAPVGTPYGEYVRVAFPKPPCPIVALQVDGAVAELGDPVTRDVTATPIDMTTGDGIRIYQRAVTFVLVVAVRELFPEARVMIDFAVALGGFFCQVYGRAPFTPAELSAIEERMRAIVEADEPIRKESTGMAEAAQLFAAQGYDDKARLMSGCEPCDIVVYELRGVKDYFYGSMVSSTGALRWFGLRHCPDGFILRLPRRQNPTVLPRHREFPKLTRVFRDYGDWLDILGVPDIGALNAAIARDEMRRIVLVSEALQEKQIAEIAADITAQKERVRLVLIAGPSSSGKTTSARRLGIQLMANGLRPAALGLDDYFVDRSRTPRDAEGNLDFEALHAVDLALFNEQLLALMAGERVRVPRFNFHLGRGEPGHEMQLPSDAIIVVEGIHGLNPDLVPNIPPESIYRIYISALAQLNIDHHNRVPTTDSRLLRRIVRDARDRGYSAQGTIERWESVRRGEENNIFPYQENADVMFNSALAYELAVLKPLAEPLLLGVSSGTPAAIEARRLLSFLRWVRPCSADLVPGNSLLREFIGGSTLKDFHF